ncbi:MAG: hypothetical protein EOO69_09455 [Moraxellaceae bacterium]|nr:MAG: hypothetical protein EOO69_09455 [Moraxellaceae bacterium]
MLSPDRKYSYTAGITELVQNGIMIPDDAYFYFEDRLKFIYDNLFTFCQVNLSEVCLKNKYDIEPARFYFYNRPIVNAGAWPRRNGYYRVTINKGTIEELWDKFCDNSILDDPELAEYKALNNYYEQPQHNISVGFIMFQTATLFTYYHELSHLIQFTNRAGGVTSLDELNMAAGARPFNFRDHIVEYDSDVHGAEESAAHVVDFWSKLPDHDRTDANLRKLIIISLVGILGFYMILLDNPKTGIYFYERSHPHPLIRIQWISTFLIGRIRDSYPHIDTRDIVDETIKVLGIYFRHKNLGDLWERYHRPLLEYSPQIKDYILDVFRTSNGLGYEYLTTRTIHQRRKV